MAKRGSSIYSYKQTLISGVLGRESRKKFGGTTDELNVKWQKDIRAGTKPGESKWLPTLREARDFEMKRYGELNKLNKNKLEKMRYG